MHHSLASLNQSLNGKLQLFKGDATLIIPQLAVAVKATAVHWNRCYEPAFLASDEAIDKQLAKADIPVRDFEGTVLWEPTRIVKKDGSPFKVYKPFLKTALAADAPKKPIAKPRSLPVVSPQASGGVTLAELGLLPKIPWDAGIKASWTPGEMAGQEMLRSFVAGKLEHYGQERDFPSHDVLSRLSPYLHYGEVSPKQVWQAIGAGKKTDDNREKFVSEVCWRDFACSVLVHFPETITQSYNARLKKLTWRQDATRLKQWQQGQTGIPIVDAGMRQLWQTGYMHNRVRMLTASFLTKNLLIDWRTGADWFLDCLVDADLAVNTLNWQWVAGTGLDAAPFFRVFNPVLQSKKYDLNGDYIKAFVPELRHVPGKYIHEPWSAPSKVLAEAGVELGKTYPTPCIDLKASAQAALDAYHKTA
nr:deoxyribodipyrimidine photo-lyase [Spirosoma sp. KNUC1025]